MTDKIKAAQDAIVDAQRCRAMAVGATQRAIEAVAEAERYAAIERSRLNIFLDKKDWRML
jgi:hypothetical protein